MAGQKAICPLAGQKATLKWWNTLNVTKHTFKHLSRVIQDSIILRLPETTTQVQKNKYVCYTTEIWGFTDASADC